MTLRLRTIAALLVVLFAAQSVYGQVGDLPRTDPENEGMSSVVLRRFFDAVSNLPQGSENHAAIVVRNGKVIGEIYSEPFGPDNSHTLYSCSKTFVALAVGMAIEQGLLNLDDKVVDFFTEYLPSNPTANLKDMEVRDLLVMASGIEPDWDLRTQCDNWIPRLFAKDISKPGETFKYDSMATYLLSGIVQKASGVKLIDFLKANLFHPMHIEEVEWEESPEGFNTGGWGLRMQPESLAKAGQLFLNKGRWNGVQLVSEEWIEEMMREQIRTPWGESYGYQMWECEKPGVWRADGAYGQYIIIAPEEQMVVVMTQCSNMPGVENRRPVYDILLSSVDQEIADGVSLPDKHYILPTPNGEAESDIQSQISGKTYILPQNILGWEKLTPLFADNKFSLAVETEDGQQFVARCGFGKWEMSSTTVCPPYSIKAHGRYAGLNKYFTIAGAYSWIAATDLEVKIYFTNWITGVTLDFDFASNSITITENTFPNNHTTLQFSEK